MSNVRDSDTSLWLHNKLGTSNDTWIGGSICSQLNSTVLRNIRECFVDLETQVKLKLLLTFLHVSRKHIEEWQTEVEEVLAIATQDSDQWVSMLAEVMQTYPATGSLNTDIGKVEGNQKIFVDLIDELKELMKKNLDLDLLPLECHYLNRTAFGQIVQPERHFSLRRRPSAVSLRADLLRRAGEAAAQLARHQANGAGLLRSRSAPRPPTSAGPSRALFRQPAGGSGGRRRPPSAPGSTPLHQAARTVKMLDITEQPSSLQRGKRRRKATEGGAREPAAAAATEEESPQLAAAAAATPDYAAGLQSAQLPAPAPVLAAALAPASVPAQTPAPLSVPAPPAAPRLPCGPTAVSARRSAADSASGGAPQPAARPAPVFEAETAPIPGPVAGPSAGPSVGPGPVSVLSAGPGPVSGPLRPGPVMYAPQSPLQPTQRPVRPVTGPSAHPPDPLQQLLLRRVGAGAGDAELQSVTSLPQPQPQQPAAERPHLTLTREQMLKAQEMFSTANKVTRPERALILGFIAGSRDNPCPHLGDVVTIKLSESVERLAAADVGPRGAAVLAETHFQMNYATGEWKRINKFRRLDKTVG